MPTHFFRVDGADQETGEETYLVLQADSKPQAEKIARKQGLLISSVRVAKASDWESTPTSAAAGNGDSEALMEEAPPEAPLEEIIAPPPASFVESKVVTPPAPAPPATGMNKQVHSPAVHASAPGSAAAVILGCVGGALIVGGVLALVLALWPDNAARNELQQLDFRLNQLNQTIIGSMLVLGGLIVFAIIAQVRACRR